MQYNIVFWVKMVSWPFGIMRTCRSSGASSPVFIGIAFLLAQGLSAYVLFDPLYKSGETGKIICLVALPFWCVFSVIWIWSYIVTCWLDAGSVLKELVKRGFANRNGELIKALPPKIDQLRRCEKCGLPKPARAHHCSQCGKCYFRFDHHCNVIGNCVALENTKAFMLFLIYSFILLLLVSLLSLAAIFLAPVLPDAVLGVISGICLFFAVAVVIFGCSYVPKVCANRTTLETIANINPQTYSAESKNANFKQIFGYTKLSWFLPTRSPVSGFMWSGIKNEFDEPTEPESNVVGTSQL